MILEFFIAFFGIIFFGTRLIGDKTRSCETTRTLGERTRAQKTWSNRYEDNELERELREMVLDESRYDDVWSIVKEDYAQMPSQSDFDSVPITFYKNSKAYPYLTTKQRLEHLKKDREDVLRLLMARRGKILAIDGIGYIAATQSGFKVDPAAHRFCEKQYDFMVRLSQVSENHNGPKIVFHAQTDGRNHELSERMHERSIGEYYWESPFYSA